VGIAGRYAALALAGTPTTIADQMEEWLEFCHAGPTDGSAISAREHTSIADKIQVSSAITRAGARNARRVRLADRKGAACWRCG